MPNQIGWFIIWQEYISFRCLKHPTNRDNSPHVAFPLLDTEETRQFTFRCGRCLCALGQGQHFFLADRYSYVYFKNFEKMVPSLVKAIPRLKEIFDNRRTR